jgi:hypothetical protein
MGAGLPAAADFLLVIALQGAFLLGVLRVIGSRGNERDLIAFSLGLVVPIAAIGVISELSLPLALLPDIAFVLFLRKLRAEYPATPDLLSHELDEDLPRPRPDIELDEDHLLPLTED